HQLVDLAGPFIDHRALAVAIEAAGRILVGVAVRAMHLDAVARRALRRDGRKPFRQPRFARVPPSLVLEEAGTQPQQTRRLVVAFHLRDHFLHELVLRDLHAERLPLLRVLAAGVPARANETRRAGRDGEAALIEREHRDLEALALLAEQIL